MYKKSIVTCRGRKDIALTEHIKRIRTEFLTDAELIKKLMGSDNMKAAYVEFKIEVPLNVTGDLNTGSKIDEIQSALEEYLIPLDAEILSHSIISKEIVYTNFRGKAFTADQMHSFVNSWMEMNEPFASMNGTLYNLAKEEVYSTLLTLLDGGDPSAIHDTLNSEHVSNVMDSINRKIDSILSMSHPVID